MITLKESQFKELLEKTRLKNAWIEAGDFSLMDKFSRLGFSQVWASSDFLREKPLNVVAPFPPPPQLASIYTHFKVVPDTFPFSYAEVELLEKAPYLREPLLESKVGITVSRSRLTFKDIVGMEVLKEELEIVKSTHLAPLPQEEKVKGVFLIGIPGVGKSYSCKCFAGEMNWPLVEFSISKLLEKERPLEAIDAVFTVLADFDGVVLWIDEIEKMFSGKDSRESKVMGRLLTVIEELNTPTGYPFKGLIWATANNVSEIAERNPEFFQRFDKLFFVELPKLEEALQILAFYFKKAGLFLGERAKALYLNLFSQIAASIAEVPQGRAPYTPREIYRLVRFTKHSLIAELEKSLKRPPAKEEIDSLSRPEAGERIYRVFQAMTEKMPPLVKQYARAIEKMREQKSIFITV